MLRKIDPKVYDRYCALYPYQERFERAIFLKALEVIVPLDPDMPIDDVLIRRAHRSLMYAELRK